jgi:hypothetical protein
MRISEMEDRECRDTLARLGFGRLGCARDNQPYIVPIYFAYEPDRLYGFATLGQKIEWLRTNLKRRLPGSPARVREIRLRHFCWLQNEATLLLCLGLSGSEHDHVAENWVRPPYAVPLRRMPTRPMSHMDHQVQTADEQQSKQIV